MRSLLAVAILLALSGCASIKTASPEITAEVKKLAPKSDIGQVYVCRDGSLFGGGIRPDVELDGKIIGTIPRSSFTYQEVQPGEHNLVIKSLEHDSKFPFKIAAGEQKYFQTWISIGIIAGRGLVDEMPTEKARECIANGELIESPRQ